MVQRRTNNREDAEDAVQESFHKAFRHIDAFQEKSRFSTWPTRIAMNEAFMLLRRRRKSRRSVLTIRWSPLRKHSLTRAQVPKSPVGDAKSTWTVSALIRARSRTKTDWSRSIKVKLSILRLLCIIKYLTSPAASVYFSSK